MWQRTWTGEWEGRPIEIEVIHQDNDKYRFRLFFDCRKLDEETRTGLSNEVVLRKRFSPKKGTTVAARAVFRSETEYVCTDSPNAVKREMIELFRHMCRAIKEHLNQSIVDPNTKQVVGESQSDDVIWEQLEGFHFGLIRPVEKRADVEPIYNKFWPKIEKRTRDLKAIENKEYQIEWFCSLTIDGQEVSLA